MEEIMKMLIHNEVLLLEILKRQGMNEEEVFKLNSTIAMLVDKRYKEYKESK